MTQNLDSKFYQTLIVFLILVLISIKLTYLSSSKIIRNPIVIIIILLCIIYIAKYNLLLSIGIFLMYICLFNGITSSSNLPISEHFSNNIDNEEEDNSSKDDDSRNEEEESVMSENNTQEENENNENTDLQEESNSQEEMNFQEEEE